MTAKLFGALLVACGIAGAVALWILSKTSSQTLESNQVRRFKLDHEYENKGFTEKGQSEGLLDIPTEISIDKSNAFESKQAFTSPDKHYDNLPGDKF